MHIVIKSKGVHILEQSMCTGVPMRVVCCQVGPWLGCQHMFDCNMECVGGNNKVFHFNACSMVCVALLCLFVWRLLRYWLAHVDSRWSKVLF